MQRPAKGYGHYAYFTNQECEYFPCHKGIDDQSFNCLFCYCPLYTLDWDCGGAFEYLENGTKDCSSCAFPHHRDNYEKIVAHYWDVVEKMRRDCE